MQKNVILKLLLVITTLLTSCTKNDEKVMNTLKINFQEGDLPSLHPHVLLIHLRGLCITKNLFEGLTRLDDQGIPQLAGAKSVEISPDKLRYTFTLRDNFWSDGTPVIASHYEQAWKLALSPLSNCSRADLLYMVKNATEAKKGDLPLDAVGVKALDDHHLLVELAYPSPYFLELAAQPVCAPLLETTGKEPTSFNGPFVLKSWKKGDQIELSRNPYFWNRSQVLLDGIEVFFVRDPATSYSLFEKGEIHWAGVPLCPLSTEQVIDLKKNRKLLSHPVDRAFWVFLNTQHRSLSSPLIRQALNLAIDRQGITQHILIGGNPLSKPIPFALLPVSSSTPISQNLVKAKELFTQGLLELGMTLESFPPIQISYSQQANRKQVAEYLQQNWGKELGIQVQLVNQDWNILRTNLEKGEYEVSGCFEAAFYKDPLELLEKFTTISANNFPKWLFSHYVDIVMKAKYTADFEERNRYLSQAEEILIEQSPFLPVCSDTLLFCHTPNLKGYCFDSVGAVDFSYAGFAPAAR